MGFEGGKWEIWGFIVGESVDEFWNGDGVVWSGLGVMDF